MLQFKTSAWKDGTKATGKYSTLPFSRTNTFHLAQVPHRRLWVAVASFNRSRLNVLKITSSGHEIDVTDEGALTITLPTHGTLEFEIEKIKRYASAGGMFVIGPSRRRTRVMRSDSGDFEACQIKIPVSTPELMELGREIHPFGAGDPLVSANGMTPMVLTSLVKYVFDDLNSTKSLLSSGRSSALVEALLLEHLRRLLEGPSKANGDFGRDPHRIVQNSEDFMRAHFCQPLLLSDIATAAGVGPRQLQAAFRKITGSTPWSRLTVIRLEQARQRLLIGGNQANVTLIALECGLAHLGRFAQVYRSRYGESPSETLRRANGWPPENPAQGEAKDKRE